MLTTLRNAFKIKEIRNKLLFTLAMLVVIRIGSQLPVPGVDGSVFAKWFEAQTGGAFSFFDAITGGSFSSMAVLALGINPYITSSIIIQLMTIAIPALEEMQKDGESGRKKMTAITRYVTVGLALIQSTAMAIGFGRQGYLIDYSDHKILSILVAVATLTAGSAFLMWVGERITEKGVGNGISIVLLINIISRLPQDIASLFERFVFGVKAPATAVLAAVVIIAIIVGMVVMVVYLNAATRHIPVQYAKKMQGRKMVGGQTSNIPLKVNTAGVIPVIFAQSLMQLPIIIPWLVTSISILLLATFVGSGRSYPTMFLGNLIVVLPYVVLLVNARFQEMDRTPEAAARLLGASPARVFIDVTLPGILPGVMAGGIMSLIVCFNNFSLQYYLSPVGVNTLPVTVFTRIKSGYQADLNALSAIIILIAVLVVILFSRMGYSAGALFGMSSGGKGKKGE